MCRVVSIVLLGLCLPCAAQEKFKPVAGDRFVVTNRLVTASELIYVGELNKALVAKDNAGLDKMVADGEISIVKSGKTIHVLEVTTNKAIAPIEYAECRLIDDGKATGKVYVFTSLFSDKYMKREAAKP